MLSENYSAPIIEWSILIICLSNHEKRFPMKQLRPISTKENIFFAKLVRSALVSKYVLIPIHVRFE